MRNKDKIIEIAIVLQPNVQLSTVYGLMDLFAIAQMCKQKLLPDIIREIRITHWKLLQDKRSIECVFDSHPKLKNTRPQILIIPPTLNQIIDAKDTGPWVEFINKEYRRGTTVCSICTGAFLLAHTGLLNGRSATTHWFQANNLQENFPDITVDADKLIIDHEDIISAGGIMSWVDLGLNLTEKIFGKPIMLKTAQFMIVDPKGREQLNYSHFSPRMNHGDESILKVQNWLKKNYAKKINNTLMAKEAGLGERTLIRRFQKGTGFTPVQYIQKLRVGQAKELLEFTNNNIDQVSWDVGYEDVTSFRKVFIKITGLTPGEYRSKFWVVS